MRRDVESFLATWRQSTDRRPLLLRGARQVGKSHLIQTFGRSNFQNLVEINLELEPQYKELFNSLDPQKILNSVSLVTGKEIVPGSTLLFFDEVQVCPEAIKALRYFYEQIPDLHVIAAGSLIEFALEADSVSVPVGRVQYLYIKPVSFLEFLSATGEEKLRDCVENISFERPPDSIVHQRLLELIRTYSVIGGMPAVVRQYAENRSLTAIEPIQALIHQTYRDDFGKYASRAKIQYLTQVYLAAPGLIAQKFKYSKVDREVGARELKAALELLVRAGVIHKVRACSAAGLPFEASVRENIFKTLFLDIGLAQRALGAAAEITLSKEYITINRGAIAEQFVGQELLALEPAWDDYKLFYWEREKRNSSAEVDYLMAVNGQVVPVEVKAGTTSKLKSLKMLMDQHKLRVGVRISEQPLQVNANILTIPFYATSQMTRLIGPNIA